MAGSNGWKPFRLVRRLCGPAVSYGGCGRRNPPTDPVHIFGHFVDHPCTDEICELRRLPPESCKNSEKWRLTVWISSGAGAGKGRGSGCSFRPSQKRRSAAVVIQRSEEHTSELQSLMRISYAFLCLNKKPIKKVVHL